MKIKTVKYIFSALLIIFAFISCEKEDVALSQPKTNETKDILSFATQEDFYKTLAKVNAMTKEERLAWEKKQGFKSFGTICDEFYETINPSSFKSVEEVKAFVAKNSDKIEFYTSSDGETYCVTKDFLSAERYLTNINQACKINNKVIVYSSNEISANQSLFMKKATSAVVTKDDKYGNCVIKGPGWFDDDTYRVHAWIKTETAGYNTCYWTTLEIKNFSLSGGIWWFIEAPVSFTYNFVIRDSNNYSFSASVTDGGWITSSNSSPRYYYTTPYISNISTPYYTSYYCKVVNTITDSDGTGHCTALMSY